MTAAEVLDTVDRLEFAADHMLAWLRRRGDRRLDIKNGVGKWACDQWAIHYAKLAGHHANQLIDLAERGRAA